MNEPRPDQVPLSPAQARRSFWYARRRRPFFLLALVIGLIVFLAWMPSVVRVSLWRTIQHERGLFILFLVFVLITVSLIWSAGQRLDARVFMFFNVQRYPHWVDYIMWAVTQLGNMVTAVLTSSVFFLLSYRRFAVEILFGTITLWLLVETIKSLVDRERPFLKLPNIRIIGWRERGDSFPSGHTSQTFFLVTFIIQRFEPALWIVLLLYAAAALVGFTRIYVGVHYPRDVIAGLVLGSVWGILIGMLDASWVYLRF